MRSESKRDLGLLRHILTHCRGVFDDIERFGDDEEIFLKDESFQRCIGMGILQVGELAKGLSWALRNDYPAFDWQDIADVRDSYAHAYWKMSRRDIWKIAKETIPEVYAHAQKLVEILGAKATAGENPPPR